MPLTIRENILANISTVLNTISIANGYANNIASVQRWKQGGNNLRQVPCIIINAGSEDKEQEPNPLVTCRFSVSIDIWMRHDEATVPGSTDTILNSLLGDIEKALMVDHTRGGNAQDTNISGNVSFETVDSQPYAGITVNVEILYRHKITDPSIVG